MEFKQVMLGTKIFSFVQQLPSSDAGSSKRECEFIELRHTSYSRDLSTCGFFLRENLKQNFREEDFLRIIN